MKSILLVEDDPFLIDIYTTKLQEAGFSVETAQDGQVALKKLPEKKFDLLILDIVLPQIDGWEILERIQNEKFNPSTKLRVDGERSRTIKMKNENLKDLKIIVLSNLGQKAEVEKGLKLGAIKYLIKAHYTPSEIVGEIKQIFK